VIERALLFADASKIRLEDLAEELRGPSIDHHARHTPTPPQAHAAHAGSHGDAGDEAVSSDGDGLKEQVKAAMSKLERDLIIRALKQTQSNVTHAARLLKISRKGLQLKMKELNLRERDPE
jgi:two-component system, NtrC family, response regulator AtoC